MSSIELVTSQLKDKLAQHMETAQSIYILTSFIMKSGVRVLTPLLQKAIENGAEVKICTGDYLFVTQPEALEALIAIDPAIEIRLFQSNGKSFHPKAYIVQKSLQEGVLIVGSSNLSQAALTNAVEWNLLVNDHGEFALYEEALDLFMQTFHHEHTIEMNAERLKEYKERYDNHHRQYPGLAQQFSKSEEEALTLPDELEQEVEIISERAVVYDVQKPRPAQETALAMLRQTALEGYNKAMVVMATGLGKTYLAAFFAQEYSSVLFLAHREELLKQAQQSFHHILPEKTTGLYYSKEKNFQADCVFASIHTLSMQQHLHTFSRDAFDLIIVDEFHHAASRSYRKVIEYFQPRFLLGLTATPDRLDGQDVYALCEGNVAYQLHFLEAIERQWLAPFHYYGVYDDIDYRAITWLGNRYDEEQLAHVQLRRDRAETILNAWTKYKQTRTLAFCSSIRQADYLAHYWNEQGWNTVSLHSKSRHPSRQEAIAQLAAGTLDVIFTVDLFNEGVDIPAVDTLLFVRPTESLTVFTQQMGRGLRLHDDKQKCVIIDLIGNYRNVDYKLQLFQRDADAQKRGISGVLPTLPLHCEWHVDLQSIALLEELKKKRQPRKEKLLAAYYEVKKELGRRPTYVELHLIGGEPSHAYRQEFSSYVAFLVWAKEATEAEKAAFACYESWLAEVEQTVMSKSYKMVVLHYMLQRGVTHWLDSVTPREVAPYFYRYLTAKNYRKNIDFSHAWAKKLATYDEKQVSSLIATMPMTKWSGSSKGFVTYEDGRFSITIAGASSYKELLHEWTLQICEYRLHRHFERKGGELHLN
ncbi:DNA/RNA helicase [Fictibacillus macauensis ZFHKF-1]|uniref:DNA/RNA helicase n=1 Tax=Fictibacillus macauensis ZFHKF-1 TaxID=1196324 RepID=I8UD57_9BACL|nr:DEAD/DEAH box helicase family protein [Fictibacillus macauensis]EIT84860.1 DNA/RNA helicase [Fictibacillus macauensis ZFHKF-1]